jgi:hypothetical protein
MNTFKKKSRVKLLSFFCLFALISFYCDGQESEFPSYDSVGSLIDSEIEDSWAPNDSTNVEARNFSATTIDRLKSDESLRYEEAPTIAESLWDRALLLFKQFLDSLFTGAVKTNWGRVFSYIFGLVLIIILIMMILRVNAFKVFYSGQGASTIPYSALHENIHELDFDKLIQEATAEGDYRKAIRLLFLHSLKMLADKNFIHWEQGKTNHDYLSELTVANLKEGFNELNYYFEYAWYGNFKVNHELFLKVQHAFTNWRQRI